MSKIWKFEAIYPEDSHDNTECYFRTPDNGTVETVITHILKNPETYGDCVLGPIEQNLLCLENNDSVIMNAKNIKRVLDDNKSLVYEIELWERNCLLTMFNNELLLTIV